MRAPTPFLRALTISLLLAGSGCALMDAFSDPEGGPDAGHQDADEPDASEPDADEPDADAPDADDPDTSEPPECDPGETRACDCDGDPIGTETCTEDSEFDLCVCPELCETADGTLVAEGSSCGICGLSEYTCDDGVASCQQPLDYNECGACLAAETPTCEAEELLVCSSDGAPRCEAAAPTLTDLTITGLADEPIVEVHYLFVPGVGPTSGCAGDWELGAAAEAVPGVYREAQKISDSNYQVALPAPGDMESGVLRVLVRQDVPLHDEPGVHLATTHFGCTGHFLSETSSAVAPDLHPFLFDGDYNVAVRFFGAGENFPATTVPPWVGRTITWALRSPGRFFAGCTNDECPSASFPGLLTQFDADRSRADVPTPSFWPGFYAEWTSFIGDADRREALLAVYEEIADEHYDLLNQIEDPFDGAAFRRFLNFQFSSNREFPLYLESFATVFRTEGIRGGLTETGQGMDVRALSGLAPWNPIALVGGMAAPHIPPMPGVAFRETSESFDLSLNLALTEVTFPSRSVTIRGAEQFRYLLFDYFPRTVYPRITEDDDGEFVTYSAEYYEDLTELFRGVFPCDDVAARLVDALNADAAAQFEPLCDDLYGDPDGREVLSQLTELLPFTREMFFNASSAVPSRTCPVTLERSAVTGIRLRSAIVDCSYQDASLTVSFGGPPAMLLVNLQLRLQRGVPVKPTSL